MSATEPGAGVGRTLSQEQLQAMDKSAAAAHADPQRYLAPGFLIERDVTRIEGQYYDLRGFAHPGGAMALRCAAGREATALFRSYHMAPYSRPLAALRRMHITDPDTLERIRKHRNFIEEDHDFDWSPAENTVEHRFQTGLFTIVNQYAESQAADKNADPSSLTGLERQRLLKITPTRAALVAALVGFYLWTVFHMVCGEWWALFVAPVATWLALVNIFHDAMHFSLSAIPRVNEMAPFLVPYLSSRKTWIHEHVIGHHVYTNVENKDPDMYHAPSMLRTTPTVRWRPAHAAQMSKYVWFMAIASLAISFHEDFRAWLTGNYNRSLRMWHVSRTELMSHLAKRTAWFIISVAWPFWSSTASDWNIVTKFLFALVPHFIFGICFMFCTQVNHLTHEAMENAEGRFRNFWMHQAATSSNFSSNSFFWHIFTGGLNMQIEHHMFPYVHSGHLPALKEKVKALCLECDVPYKEFNSPWDALKCHLTHMTDMASKPFSS